MCVNNLVKSFFEKSEKLLLFLDKITRMKKLAKVIWIIVGIVFVFMILIISLAKSNTDNPSDDQQPEATKAWVDMVYEERQSFLENSIEKRTFANASELEVSLKESIKKEVRNPKTLTFVWNPSIYNGGANVVEADSAWIYVPFKCNAKNDFGVEKEIMGSVMYKYLPESNSLSVHKWEINQNN